LEGFVQSDIGELTYHGQTEWNVRFVESQADWSPIQRNFLALAADYYGPDESEIPDEPPTRSTRGMGSRHY